MTVQNALCRWVSALVALAAAPVVAQTTAALPGGPLLSYQLSVEPQHPVVGDAVRLRFAVGIDGTGGLPQYTLQLNDGVLSGDTGPITRSGPLPDTVEFELDAVGAGVAEARLQVNYEGAYAVEGQCCVYHFTTDQSETFRVPVIATTAAQAHRVTVHIGSGEGTCSGGYPGRDVELYPTGRTAESDAAGIATFDGVADGDYELRMVPPCVGGSCFAYEPIRIAGEDFAIDLCAPLCTSQVFLEPESGPPGTEVAVEGACQFIHSGGTSPLLFGPITLGQVRGDTAGDFHETFVVPYVPPGEYPVSAAHGTAVFQVDGDFPGCDGDCNGDLEVRIGELTRCVGIALGTMQSSTCPVFGAGVSVAQLIRAVRAALDGCSALSPAVPTPTPVESTNDPCEACCADCSTAACVEQCVGHDVCDLIAEWTGVVRDANGAAVVNARVTLNQETTTTDDFGEYSITSVREELCSGLDYQFDLTVTAAGYLIYHQSLYRVPAPRQVNHDVTMTRSH